MQNPSDRRSLRSVIIPALLLIGLAALAINAFWNSGSPVVELYRTAPNFTLAKMGGGDLQLRDFRGKVVLLNFWATWCEPCKEEMPLMQAVYETYRDQGFEIIAVNLAEEEGRVRRFIEEIGATFPVVYDITGGVHDMYLIRNMPTSYFIDRNGVVQAQITAPLTEEQILAVIKDLL